MFFGLLKACQRFFPVPGTLESSVKQFALSIGIQIEIEQIAPSTLTKQ
jgi:hypothetical protein